MDGACDTLCRQYGQSPCRIKVDDVLTAEVEKLGKTIENHPAFPERVNVGVYAGDE